MKLIFSLIAILFFLNAATCQSLQDSLIQNHLIVSINGSQLSMKLDLGSSVSLIQNTSNVGGVLYYSNLDKETRKLKLPTRTINQDFYKIPLIESAIGNIKNLSVLINEEATQLNCKTSMVTDGILGTDFLEKIGLNNLLILDYQNGLIGNVNADRTKNFKELDSKFKDGLIYLYLKVDGKKQKVLLDSGSSEFLILLKNRLSGKNFTSRVLESPLMDAVNGYIPNKTTYYSNVPINMAGFTTNQSIISVNKELHSNILGLPFIKNFNWLIDFENEKIYAQQHSNEFDNSWLDKLDDINEMVLAVNDKLMVFYSSSGIKIGSVIKSIDGTEITNENLCEYQNLLLKNNADWSAFNIQFN